MTLIKNKIPILEYDDSPCAVLMPTHEKLDIHLPEKAVFVFLGDSVEAYACSEKAEKVAEFVSVTKKYPIYVVDYGGENICLCQAPMGGCFFHTDFGLADWVWGQESDCGRFLWCFGGNFGKCIPCSGESAER